MDKIEALRKRLISSAKKKIQEKYEGKETHIIKSVNLLEDIDSSSNLLIEQLREWYSVYFPELDSVVSDNEKYVELVYSVGERKNFTQKEVAKIVKDTGTVTKIVEKAKKSIGTDIDKEDLAEMQTLALNSHNLRQERAYLAKYIERGMQTELPNFTELAGAIIGAKILSQAGSKKKLAFMPASTIQLIGAEKALFLHIKTGVKGPKYGYLFQHPLVKTAKTENKGRLARSLAAKLAIAAKKDYFGNRSSASDMKKELDERAKELQERKPGKKPKTKVTVRRDTSKFARNKKRKFKPSNNSKKPDKKFGNKKFKGK
ncbi:C/D box methylation guide ribonucleoprotein complex aNOP56 subunit [archaeon]|nr:C/D box methylation guide ribonucleoprotein complex aNOP56 subunit [archaeon]